MPHASERAAIHRNPRIDWIISEKIRMAERVSSTTSTARQKGADDCWRLTGDHHHHEHVDDDPGRSMGVMGPRRVKSAAQPRGRQEHTDREHAGEHAISVDAQLRPTMSRSWVAGRRNQHAPAGFAGGRKQAQHAEHDSGRARSKQVVARGHSGRRNQRAAQIPRARGGPKRSSGPSQDQNQILEPSGSGRKRRQQFEQIIGEHDNRRTTPSRPECAPTAANDSGGACHPPRCRPKSDRRR